MGTGEFYYAGDLNQGLGPRDQTAPPPKPKSKRERAADLINEGRRLARQALDEENREAELSAEYGPRLK